VREQDPTISVVVPVLDPEGAADAVDRTLAALASASAAVPDLVLDVVVVTPVGAPDPGPGPARLAVRTAQAAPGDLVAVGAGAARAPYAVLLEAGEEPGADDVRHWQPGPGAVAVPTSVLRGLGGSDATAGARLRALDAHHGHSAGAGLAVAPVVPPSVDSHADSYAGVVLPRLAVLAELAQVPTPTAEARAAVAEAADPEVDALARHLRAHPEDRPRLVEEVEERGLDLDWSRLNTGAAQELALLYCFTPWSGTSGLVAARRIRARGAVVDVITQQMDNIRSRDEASRAIAAPYVADQVVVPGDATFAQWDGIVRYVTATTDVIEEGAFAGRAHRSVYSRAMFPASHVAAARHKLRHPEIRWRAEFSDPLSKDVHGQDRPAVVRRGPLLAELRKGLREVGVGAPDHLLLLPWVEHLAYALADEIVFTNENQRDYMLGYCPDPALRERVAERSSVSHHPTLPPPFYRREPSTYDLDPDRVHVGYFGVFYATRGLTEVTDAFARLPGHVRSRVQLHVFTTGPEEVAAGVAAAGLGDVVRVNGYRPFLEFLHLTTRFDVLLVNDADHEGINPYLPSKLSDYLGSGSDIWAISQPGSVLSRQDLAYRSSLHDVDAAVEVLTRIAARGR